MSENDKEWFDAELLLNVKKELGQDYGDMASETVGTSYDFLP